MRRPGRDLNIYEQQNRAAEARTAARFRSPRTNLGDFCHPRLDSRTVRKLVAQMKQNPQVKASFAGRPVRRCCWTGLGRGVWRNFISRNLVLPSATSAVTGPSPGPTGSCLHCGPIHLCCEVSLFQKCSFGLFCSIVGRGADEASARQTAPTHSPEREASKSSSLRLFPPLSAHSSSFGAFGTGQSLCVGARRAAVLPCSGDSQRSSSGSLLPKLCSSEHFSVHFEQVDMFLESNGGG